MTSVTYVLLQRMVSRDLLLTVVPEGPGNIPSTRHQRHEDFVFRPEQRLCHYQIHHVTAMKTKLDASNKFTT